MATERIVILIREDGSRVVRRNIESIGGSAERTAQGVDILKGALRGLAAAFGLREMARAADTWSTIRWRIRNATSSSEEAADTLNRLSQVARTTWSSIEQTTTAFLQQTQSLQALGYTTREQIDHVEALNSALLISGLRGQRAQLVADAWNRAMAQGALRGEDFNTIIRDATRLTEILSEVLGTNVNDLRRLAAEGKITSDVMYQIVQALPELRKEMEGDATLRGSMIILRNSFTELVGRIDEATRLTNTFGMGLVWVADNLDKIAISSATILAVYQSWNLATVIGSSASQMIALQKALGGAGGAWAVFTQLVKTAHYWLLRLMAIIAVNPLASLIIGLGAAATALYLFSDEITVTEDGLVTLSDVAVSSVQLIVESLGNVVSFFGTAWDQALQGAAATFSLLGVSADHALAGILIGARYVINAYIGAWNFAYQAISIIWNNFPGLMDNIFTQVINLGIAAAEQLINVWQVPFRGLQQLASLVDSELADSIGTALDSMLVTLDRRKVGEAGAQFADDFNTAFSDAFDRDYLGDALDTVMERARARAQARVAQAAEDAASGSGGGGGGGGGGAPFDMDKLRSDMSALLRLVDPVRHAVKSLAEDEKTLDRAMRAGLITTREKAQYVDRLRQQYRELVDPLGHMNDEMDKSIRLAGMHAEQRHIEREVLHRIQDLQRAGIDLTNAEVQALRNKVQALHAATEAMWEQDRMLQATVGRRKEFLQQLQAAQELLADPTSGFTKSDAFDRLSSEIGHGIFEGTQDAIDAQLAAYQNMYDQIQAMRDADLISQQTATQAMARVDAEILETRLSNYSSYFGTLAGLAESGNSKVAAIGKAAAIAQATIDGVVAVQKALASAPPPFNYALAAAVAVQTANNVQKIMSSSTGFMTGGSFVVGGSGGADSQMVAFRATPGERVQVSTPTQVRKGTEAQSSSDGGTRNVYNLEINVRDPGNEQSARRSGKVLAREIGRVLQRVGSDLPR